MHPILRRLSTAEFLTLILVAVLSPTVSALLLIALLIHKWMP